MVSLDELTPELLSTNLSETLMTLKDDDVWKRIPLISNLSNFDRLKEMQLVRFRGLIQDMRDPEIYLETFQTKCAENGEIKLRSAKYRDNVKIEDNEEIIFNSDASVHKERRTIFMVSIPGLNDWSVDLEKESANQMETAQPETLVSAGVKRSLDVEETVGETAAMDTDEPQTNKKRVSDTNGVDSNAKGLSKEYQLNSPIADRPSNACMIKFYDDTVNLKLNQVIDVVGFLSIDPSLCGSNRTPEEYESFDEVCAMNPPPSLIPRIHAITYRSLAHLNPLLHDGRTLTLTEQQKNEIFQDLRKILSQCLLGDNLAADYLFCHLISTVYVRCEEETLGQFSMNITNVPIHILPDYTKQLYEIIELILPASHYFPITLDNLNTTEFIPIKDYETGMLTSGLLQLAPHTHLVLDETCLQAGKLESRGIESVMHVSNLIRKQMLSVNFKFYTIDYNSNIPVLILSEGKSMFPSNCHVPLKCDEEEIRLVKETFAAIRQFIKPKLNLIRGYLTMLRLQDFDMDPQDKDMIQTDFVEMRRNFNANADDLHSLLILSRMLGIIQGKTNLDKECWSQAKQMEQDRRHRINNLSKK